MNYTKIEIELFDKKGNKFIWDGYTLWIKKTYLEWKAKLKSKLKKTK